MGTALPAFDHGAGVERPSPPGPRLGPSRPLLLCQQKEDDQPPARVPWGADGTVFMTVTHAWPWVLRQDGVCEGPILTEPAQALCRVAPDPTPGARLARDPSPGSRAMPPPASSLKEFCVFLSFLP